jgi:uncharacterized protein YjbJ (UPF0337 family)
MTATKAKWGDLTDDEITEIDAIALFKGKIQA